MAVVSLVTLLKVTLQRKHFWHSS